jgi:hypothetical protein
MDINNSAMYLLILALACAGLVCALAISGRHLLRGVKAALAREAAPAVILALVAGGMAIASGLILARWFGLI